MSCGLPSHSTRDNEVSRTPSGDFPTAVIGCADLAALSLKPLVVDMDAALMRRFKHLKPALVTNEIIYGITYCRDARQPAKVTDEVDVAAGHFGEVC